VLPTGFVLLAHADIHWPCLSYSRMRVSIGRICLTRACGYPLAMFVLLAHAGIHWPYLNNLKWIPDSS
jgi:hypothetical protein